MVVGPLGESDGGPLRGIGLGETCGVLWSILRWPVLLLVLVGFLVRLLRFSPNVRHNWHQCLPAPSSG